LNFLSVSKKTDDYVKGYDGFGTFFGCIVRENSYKKIAKLLAGFLSEVFD